MTGENLPVRNVPCGILFIQGKILATIMSNQSTHPQNALKKNKIFNTFSRPGEQFFFGERGG